MSISGRNSLLVFFTFLACAGNVTAEDRAQRPSPESVIERIERLRAPHVSSADTTESDNKCGLGMSFEVAEYWSAFSDAQKQRLLRLFTAPSRQKSRVIGHFTIMYDTTGFDAPGRIAVVAGQCQRIPGTVEEYIDSVGRFFNESWDTEIGSLGFLAPPLGADNTYLIDVHDLGGRGLYGQTFFGATNPFDPNPIDAESPPRYRTYIEVDNDYCPTELYYSPGMSGLKVTAAHEFHHAIQLGSYGYRGNDLYFYEITSTWMEDVVYTSVNDYYQYLSNTYTNGSEFASPDVGFQAYNPEGIQYSRAVWGKFIEQRYSRDVMRHSWEYMRTFASVSAMDHALGDIGASFRRAFLEWAVWNEKTGPDCDTVRYYSEGKHYPIMRLRSSVQYLSPRRIIADSIQALSSVYHPVLVGNAQMMVIISNVSLSSSTFGKFGFSYVLSDGGDETYKRLANGLSVKLLVPDPENWSTQESVPSVVTDVVAYPDPFLAEGSRVLRFRLPPVASTHATLAIFSVGLDRIISAELPVEEPVPSEPYLGWDGHDEMGRLVPSGIYFYVISIDGKKYTGKFAVVRN